MTNGELRRAVERLSNLNLDRALDAAQRRQFDVAETIIRSAAAPARELQQSQFTRAAERPRHPWRRA